MKKSQFSEQQIAFAIADVCRKAGISEATFYNWPRNTAG